MFEPNAENIKDVINASDLRDLIAEFSLTINEEKFGIKINPLGMYCQKTGYEIAQRTENSLLQLIQVLGGDVTGNLYNVTSLCTHPLWIETSPDDLDILIERDPIGYACYCLNIITKDFYQTNKPGLKDLRRLPYVEKHWSLARANQLMRERGNADLDRLNVSLANLIQYLPESTNYLFSTIGKFAKTPDELALLHCNGDLIALLDDAANKTLDSIGYKRMYAAEYIKKTRFIDIAATPADAARGPSNIRKQRVTKEKLEDATMFAELRKLAEAQGFKFASFNEKPDVAAIRAKVEVTNHNRELSMMADLMELASLSNLALPEIEDESEDELSVEFRTLPVSEQSPEASETSISQTEIIQNHPYLADSQNTREYLANTVGTATPTKLTGLALLRARKNGG